MDVNPVRVELREVFAATKLRSDAEAEFALVGLPPESYYEVLTALASVPDARFQSLVRESWEVTLIAPRDLWESISHSFPRATVDAPWKLITLDIMIPLDVYGYLEQVARTCAEQGASVMVSSGYSTDHLLVAAEHYQAVVAALGELIAECQAATRTA